MSLRVGVAGARGQMGQAVVRAALSRSDLTLDHIFDRPGSEGQKLDDLTLTSADAAMAACDVLVDFTTPAASAALATAAAARGGVTLVIGATGWTDADEATLRSAAERVAIVRSGNFSLGVNVLLGLAEQAARRLDAADWDAEIAEAHHRRKVDAPSGTALMLGEAVARGRGTTLAAVRAEPRDGVSKARESGSIGFAVTRGGGVVGDHSVIFAADDEIVTLSHSARDRSLFARGALTAARWIAGKPPGLYHMADVLGFRDQPPPVEPNPPAPREV